MARSLLQRDEVLTLVAIVRHTTKHAPIHDQRRRVNYTLAEYAGENGDRYRKGFSSYDTPVVPEQGTHGELGAMSYQGVLRSQVIS